MIKSVLAIVAAIGGTPQCQVVATGELAPCYSNGKIDRAVELLGGSADRDYVISVEMNRGQFATAEELAAAVRSSR